MNPRTRNSASFLKKGGKNIPRKSNPSRQNRRSYPLHTVSLLPDFTLICPLGRNTISTVPELPAQCQEAETRILSASSLPSVPLLALLWGGLTFPMVTIFYEEDSNKESLPCLA